MPVDERAPRPLTSEWEIADVVGFLPNASNATLLAVITSGDFVVYKPAAGERPLWDFPPGTLPRREVLTYEVSHALGLGVVPETRLLDGPHGEGSAQRFVAEDPEFDPRQLFLPHLHPSLWPIALLDILCDNADRKVGHILRDGETERLWAIDNSLTFNVEPKLRTVLWGFAGETFPPSLADALVRLELGLEVLVARVAELLTHREAAVFETRARSVLADRTHPQPPTDRPPVPWPVY